MTLLRPAVKSLLLLALLFTLLNSIKPLCIDDTLYYYRARQVAEHPLDPYGFQLFWNDRPEPAMGVLAPPLFPYWWAMAIKFFGERPFLWKLWLLPLSLLLVFSLAELFRRFAPGHELILTWMIVISPTFLPSFNLMLEIPVSTLIFFSLVLFFRSHDRGSWALAACSGLVGGLAMQTKYTAFVLPVVMLLYVLLFKKARLGLLAAALAVLVFWSIEGYIAWRSGHSHLLYQSQVYGSVSPLKKYLYLSWPLVTTIGGVAPAVALLGLTALKVPRQFVLMCMIVVALGYVLLAVVPYHMIPPMRDALTGEERTVLVHFIFGVFGLAVYLTLALVVRRLFELPDGWANLLNRWQNHRVELFLVLWLAVEVGTYFALSPIAATRRVLGVLLVSTLLIGRLASRTCESLEGKRLVRAVAVFGMMLGLLFYSVDLHDAVVEKIAAERAAQRIAALDQNKTAWYVGRWGFQYYAEHLGMKPVVPDESQFQPGDWLIISDGPYFPKPVQEHINQYTIEPVGRIILQDSLPLSTMMGYYNSGIPLHHHEGPHRTVAIYRITGKAR